MVMIIPVKIENNEKSPDFSVLTDEQYDNHVGATKIEVDGVEMYEITFNEKYERNLLKEENKRLKAELKLQRDRIADATDFADLKSKLTKIKDSEEKPEKWKDKEFYLKGQYVEHKGLNYLVLEDHESDKAKEPDVTPEWYERI